MEEVSGFLFVAVFWRELLPGESCNCGRKIFTGIACQSYRDVLMPSIVWSEKLEEYGSKFWIRNTVTIVLLEEK